MMKKIKYVQAPEYVDMSTSCLEIIKQMQKLVEKYGPSVEICKEQAAWTDDYENNVYYTREETDEECSARLEVEERYRQEKVASELAQYKALREKFGDI